MPLNATDTVSLLDRVDHDELLGDDTARRQILDAARRLVTRLETPFEIVTALCFDHPVIYASLQTCLDMGLWEKWCDSGGGQKSLAELVELLSVDCEANLLRETSLCRTERILLILCDRPSASTSRLR